MENARHPPGVFYCGSNSLGLETRQEVRHRRNRNEAREQAHLLCASHRGGRRSPLSCFARLRRGFFLLRRSREDRENKPRSRYPFLQLRSGIFSRREPSPANINHDLQNSQLDSRETRPCYSGVVEKRRVRRMIQRGTKTRNAPRMYQIRLGLGGFSGWRLDWMAKSNARMMTT